MVIINFLVAQPRRFLSSRGEERSITQTFWSLKQVSGSQTQMYTLYHGVMTDKPPHGAVKNCFRGLLSLLPYKFDTRFIVLQGNN